MNTHPIRTALLIEDNPGDARLLREMLRDQGEHQIGVTHVGCMFDAEASLLEHVVDVILVDLGLPDAQGLDALRRARAAAPHAPVVVLTGSSNPLLALQALQAGAQDYLVKCELEGRGLVRSLRYAVGRKHLEDALFEEKERAEVTLNSIGDAVICTDSAGDVTFLNVIAERMTGWTRTEALGCPIGAVFTVIEGMCLSTRDGAQTPIERSVAPIHDRNGHTTGSVIVFRDVSVARAMQLEMKHSAQHDALTGLPNRFCLNDRVAQAVALARRHDTQVGLLYLDLDGFKHINDSLGHAFGDKLLASVAKRLTDCGRTTDTVSRQGGDEFVVLLSELAHAEDAAIAASRMLKAVAEPHIIEGHELHVTTSIGISIFPYDGATAEALIQSADTAMYQAKETGRDSFQFFRPAMNARAVERQFLEESLRRAVERNELTLHYQPKVNFRTRSITGSEALLRWTHPTRGAISPAQFIPVAEDSGLIVPLGNWVLRRACEQAGAWIEAGLTPGTIAVNVSAMEFRDHNFLAGLFRILDDTKLPPSLLELELTESVLMKHPESAATTLQALRKRGVRIAIDDFGTGYSSLTYLRRFPIDALKIDQSFVAQITTTPEDANIVKAVISMARSLRLRVVAEGVETGEQMSFLQAQDCDEAQGYYFSRPLAAVAFGRLLAGPRSLLPACAA